MESEVAHLDVVGGTGAVNSGRLWWRAGEFLFVVLVYFALAKLGLTLASINPSASPIWPPTGFALAMVILSGTRVGPAIFLGALIANATTAGSLLTSLAIAIGNTAEALLGGYLVRGWSNGPRTFDTPSGVARFALLGAAVATPISATVGVASLTLAGFASPGDFVSVWTTWWLGDLASALVFAPVIVLWMSSPAPLDRRAILESGWIAGATILVGLLAFSPLISATVSRTDALAFLAILPLMWSALRGSQRDTATVSVILSCFAIWDTMTGHGPFARAELNGSFLLLLTFMISAQLPSLALSAGVSERRHAESALRDSEARLRSLTDRLPNAAVYQIIVEGKRRYYTYASRGIERIRGVTAEAVLADPLLLRRQVLPEYLAALEAADDEATGQLTPFEHEFEVRLPDGGLRWLHLSSAPRRLSGGRVAWDGVQIDITERKRADERLRLMAHEIDHRAKNLLAVVQSILNLSKAEDVKSFVSTVRGRVMAIARAHTLLSDSRWEGADLRRLLDEELDPYRTSRSRVFLGGPAASLVPAACQPLALALHELATNAAKFGALSVPTGLVAVGWSIHADGLTLTWREQGGPSIAAPPARKGFGSTVLIGSVERQLFGRVMMDWRAEGLAATFILPASVLAPTALAPTAAFIEERTPPALAGRRVLVVEDEILVAMDIARALEQAGSTVVGPAQSLAKALHLAETESFDAALLDRNLGGETTDAIARRLRDRGIPFAVVSGYADTSLPADLGDTPLLAKPFEPDELTAFVGRLIAPVSSRVPSTHR